MKAMVLAAGLGTRLRPLTNDRPKALVEVSGRTMLEITLARLREFGIQDVIINVHHFADKLLDYLKAANNFGMRVEISREDILLDTGGGLKQAGWFFTEGSSADANTGSANTDAAFILHNVDIISNIDLRQMLQFHNDHQAIATLAVQDRATSRYLIFNDEHELCGRRTVSEQKTEMVRSARQTKEVAFTGVHIISPRIFPLLKEEGVFSIIPAYLRLAQQGEKILAFNADKYYWRDLGKPEHIRQAEKDIAARLITY